MGVLSRLLETAESRDVGLRDPGLIKLFNLWRTRSGMQVTPDTAMTLSSVFLAVKILSESIASLPLHLFRRLEDGGKERVTDHALDELLSRRPNSWQTPFEFKEMMACHLVMRGNAIAEKIATGGNSVTELIPLHPDHITIRREMLDLGGGRRPILVYEHRQPNGVARILFQHEVMHWRGLGFDGVRGFSPITVQRETIGNAMAVEAYGQTFFGNAAIPAAVLEHPAQLDEAAHDRLRKSWNERYGGGVDSLQRSGGLAILEEGMKYTQLGLTNEDAQFLDSRRFNVVDVARIFNIPPHMLMELGRATFNNIEQMSLSFVVNTLLPWVIRIEQATQRDLVTNTASQGGRLFVAFLLEQRMRGDFKSRMDGYAIGRQWGLLSLNDVNKLENRNPIDEPWANEYLIPLNMVPASAAGGGFGGAGAPPGGNDDDDDPDGNARALADQQRLIEHDARGRIVKAREDRSVRSRNNLKAAHLPLFHDTVSKVVRAQCREIRAAAKRMIGERNVAELRNWLETYFRDQRDKVGRTLAPLASTYARAVTAEILEEIGESQDAGDALDLFVRDYVAGFSTRFNENARGQLAAILTDIAAEDAAETVEARLTEWEGDGQAESRSMKAAKRETSQLANAVAVFTYANAGVVQMRWRTQGDNCPLCNAMSGRVVSVTGAFAEKGEEIGDGEGQTITTRNKLRHPPLHQGCDCVVVAELQ